MIPVSYRNLTCIHPTGGQVTSNVVVRKSNLATGTGTVGNFFCSFHGALSLPYGTRTRTCTRDTLSCRYVLFLKAEFGVKKRMVIVDTGSSYSYPPLGEMSTADQILPIEPGTEFPRTWLDLWLSPMQPTATCEVSIHTNLHGIANIVDTISIHPIANNRFFVSP